MQDTRNDPTRFVGHRFHDERGADAPFPAHGDAVQRPKDQEHREPGRKAGQELEDRIEQHIRHQGDAAAETVCRQPEDQSTNRAHRQRQEDCRRDGRNVGVKFFGNVFENEDENEEIGGIEGPAEIAGDQRIALLRCKCTQTCQCGHLLSSIRKRRRGGAIPDAVGKSALEAGGSAV